MRRMNRIALAGPDLAILGPGGTWEDVLNKLPPTHYTMIHGQCTSVGVGEYIKDNLIYHTDKPNSY